MRAVALTIVVSAMVPAGPGRSLRPLWSGRPGRSLRSLRARGSLRARCLRGRRGERIGADHESGQPDDEGADHHGRDPLL